MSLIPQTFYKALDSNHQKSERNTKNAKHHTKSCGLNILISFFQ